MTLPLFPNAKLATAVPLEPIVRSASIVGEYRYELRRAWGSGSCLGWVMLNPSTADAGKDDPTVQRIMNISCRLGYGSLLVVNIYPFRSPHPIALRKWRETMDDHVFLMNARWCGDVLQACQMTIAAWGNDVLPEHLDWWMEVVAAQMNQEFFQNDRFPTFYCLGRTLKGAPKHPLARGKHRIPNDQEPVVWRKP